MSHRGKRAGKRHVSNFARSVQRESQHIQDTGSTSGVVAEGKKGYSPAMFECFEETEQTEINQHGLIIPGRKSLTQKLHLGLFPQTVEYKDEPNTQIDKLTGLPVTVTNPVVVWKSDKTLLRRGKPDTFDPNSFNRGFKRQTSKTKRVIPDGEIEIVNTDDLGKLGKLSNGKSKTEEVI